MLTEDLYVYDFRRARHQLLATQALVDILWHAYIVGMQIGNLNLKGRVISAPLAGVSNRPFRLMALAHRAALVYTEMISAEGLIRYQKRTEEMVRFGDDERPIGVQLFGANPDSMQQAARITAEKYQPDLIDINFGCPVKKVVNKNGGAAVLKDLILTAEIIRAVVEGAEKIPVTIKIRTGWDEANSVYLEAGRLAEAAGAKAVTLHARSRSRGFAGAADWSAIARLKEAVGITVIGNGDVVTPQDARRMLDETGCDLVMVGRAAMGNPYLYEAMHHYVETGELQPEPGLEERIDMACRHAELLADEYGQERGAIKMRKYLGWYVKGFPGASSLRPLLFQVESTADIVRIFKEYLSGPLSRRAVDD